MKITYTTSETLARGRSYAAHVTIAGRHVILGHWLLDNHGGSVQALKKNVERNATALLRQFGYTEEEIASME
jgi:hypothetical protein